MVKLGFIVEGDTEKIILQSDAFQDYLRKLELNFIEKVVNVGGADKLLPKFLEPITNILVDEGATHIFILTDLDEDKHVNKTKERIEAQDIHIVVIAIKTIEAWFLADTDTISAFFQEKMYFEYPEQIDNPFEAIKELRLSKLGRGVSSKKILARILLKCGFSIEKAAQHPHCSSAQYFIKKIEGLSGK